MAITVCVLLGVTTSCMLRSFLFIKIIDAVLDSKINNSLQLKCIDINKLSIIYLTI